MESEGPAEDVITSADNELLHEARGSDLGITGAASEVTNVSKLTSGVSWTAKTPRGASMKSVGGAKGASAASKMAKTSPKEAAALPRWATQKYF